MPKVLLITEPAKIIQGDFTLAPTELIVEAMKRAITGEDSLDSTSKKDVDVAVMTTEELAHSLDSGELRLTNVLVCPLTLNLPDRLQFPMQKVFQRCQDVVAMRQIVSQWHYPTGAGDLWLPIVLSAKGPLYSEIIGCRNSLAKLASAALLPDYVQPVHLTDKWRQILYEFGYRVLKSVTALPSVYLIQFGLKAEGICFDRLLPFPGAPAIASLNVQTPDLFVCHWHCMVGKPLYDLVITASDNYSIQ